MRKTEKARTLVAVSAPGLLLVVVLLLAACGSPSSAATTAQPAPTTAPPAATPVPFPTPAPTVAFPAVPQTMVVQWEKNARLGDILTDPQGRTVYTYKDDKPGQSACTGDCARTWPPVTIAKGWQPFVASGVPGKVGVITRPDGTDQVTYQDAPLYRYSGDKVPGDANGQGLNNLWFAVPVTPTP